MAHYKRILLKLSGEALAGESGFGFDAHTINKTCEQIKRIAEMGVQIAVVVGGGNIWRGRSSGDMDRTTADYMGMLATAINSLAIKDSLEQLGVPVLVQSAIPMDVICDPFSKREAVKNLEQGRVVVFAAGTGSPFFSTDTTAALRAAEIGADAILSAKTVDGVYDSDPSVNKAAVKYNTITFKKILEDSLKVIDSTAASLCMENGIPIVVFSMKDPQNFIKAVSGEQVGTLVT
ncbi:MAG: UMP kinase [Eubacteriaceae bacterium]|nr:UMP kinase [Eubacteriaceae bacterium]